MDKRQKTKDKPLVPNSRNMNTVDSKLPMNKGRYVNS